MERIEGGRVLLAGSKTLDLGEAVYFGRGRAPGN